jgi:hypothetical protein
VEAPKIFSPIFHQEVSTSNSIFSLFQTRNVNLSPASLEVNIRKTLIYSIGMDSVKLGNVAHFMFSLPEMTEDSNFHV